MAMPGVTDADLTQATAPTPPPIAPLPTVAAAESFWLWDSRSRRYRITRAGAEALGQRAGTFVGQSRMVGLRDAYIAQSKLRTNALAAQVANGEISIQQWQIAMRQVVKDTFINEYMLGAGGRNAMTQADWGRVGQMVRNQYEYLDNFAQDILNGRYTEAGVAARGRMYPEAASQAFERGNTEGRGMPPLPQVPGDGQTRCLSNCKCSIQIKERDEAWDVYWKLSPAEHCEDCLELASRWNPLVIPKSNAATRSLVMEYAKSLPEYHRHSDE